MGTVHETFGARINRLGSAEALLVCEREHGLRERFVELDSIVGSLLVRSLRGVRIVDLNQDDLYVSRVWIRSLDAAQRELIEEWFAVDKQQARGLWTLPQKATMQIGFASLRWAYSQWGRFGTGLASEERASVRLSITPDGVFHWAILEDLFRTLFLPFELRGPLAGAQTRGEVIENWAEIDILYKILGFKVDEEVAVMRYGGGWHKLDMTGQLEAKMRLLDALGRQASVRMGERYRAYRILPFVAKYYQAKKKGPVKRRQALTKALERTLSAYWGGDWLAFVSYIGEGPHPEEQITTAIPKVAPMVSQSSRIENVAAEQGLSPEVVRSIAAAYWQATGGQSPVELRVDCLQRYWNAFDEIHARQTGAIKPLWGLVAFRRDFILGRDEYGQPFPQDQCGELLSAELRAEIDELWGGTLKPNWPNRIVTEPFPREVMAGTFGPALAFWNRCASRAWSLCESFDLSNDMSGVARYHRRELAALEAMGTPVSDRLFADLVEAEKQLGSPQDVQVEWLKSSITVRKRRGFEGLRDVITCHRRAWAATHLRNYLRIRWESEITEAARAYNLLVQNRDGRVPTLKQFARAATRAVNHWFGGDISGLYAAIQEKCPVRPRRVRLMPDDILGFGRRLYESLPSRPFQFPGGRDASSYRESHMEAIANLGVHYIQMEEALGRPPRMNEIGETFPYYSQAMSDDVQEAWEAFVAAVDNARNVVPAG